MTAVWRCAKCGRTQGEDIEATCACGSTVWVGSAPPWPGESRPPIWALPAPRTAYTVGADPAVPCDGDGFFRWDRTETGWNLFRSVGDGSWVFDRHIERERDAPMNECKTCNGQGYLEGMAEVLRDERGVVEVWDREECQDCDGTGFEAEQPTALDYCPKPNTP